MANQRRVQLLVRFGYDGTRFHGLQPQPGLPTAGGALRERVYEASGQRPRALAFAARTDAGVHALENAATFWLEGPLDVESFARALQAPRDDGLWLVRAHETPWNVHARGSSRGKRYRYRLEDGCAQEDTWLRYAWHVVPRLEEERLRASARQLVGTHDFSSFRAPRCTSSTPVKTLTEIRVGGPFRTTGERRLFFIDIVGDAFLRKMVRILVGTLVEVAVGFRDPGDIPGILAARRRDAAGIAAPARGLVLMKVGMAWPPDGSGLVRELAGLVPVADDEDC